MFKLYVSLLLLLVCTVGVLNGLPTERATRNSLQKSVSDSRSKTKNSVSVIRSYSVPEVDGYNFLYETSDGVLRSEKGGFVDGIWTVVGSMSTPLPDGKFRVQYFLANHLGYKSGVKIVDKDEVTKSRSHSPWEEDGDKIGSGALASLVGAG